MKKKYINSISTVGVVYQPNPTDTFSTDIIGVDASGNDIKARVSDIRILLNQIRIDSNTLNSLLEHILGNVRSGDMSDRFKHLTDNQIISCIKSRYIQSPSELVNWSEYLESELTRLEAAQKSVENLVSTPPSDTTPAPSAE